MNDKEEVMSVEKKPIVLVLIALLIGLGGGYGLGVAIYQPQISTIQSNISDIQSILSPNKTWHTMANFNLSADHEWVSSVFTIHAELWRINWTKAGNFMSVTGWAGFLICKPGQYVIEAVDLRPALSGPLIWSGGTHYMYGVPGDYFIILQGIGADGISFTVESYLPPLK